MKIYIMNIHELQPNKMDEYIKLCDSTRQKTVPGYRHQADQLRGIAAGLLLRYAYRSFQKETGRTEVKELVLTYGAYGKPYIADEREFYFSLSHAGDYVLLAVSRTEIGADIERVTEKKDVLHLAKRFFHEEEYKKLTERIGLEQTIYFYRLWTIKESYLKYLGRGLSYGMNGFVMGENNQIFDDKMLLERAVYIQEYTGIDDYCVTICTEEVTGKPVRIETNDFISLQMILNN